MKKITAVVLVLAMVVSLSGCSMIKNKIANTISEAVGDAISDVVGGDLSSTISDTLGGLGGDLSSTISDALGGLDGDLSSTISDALGGIGGDVSGIIGDAAGDALDGAVDEAVASVAGRHERSYWADKFGTNYCPFSIDTLGIETSYHFRDGGELEFWVYSEENTSGWYVYNGYIISNDNAFAIKISDADYFSSCCTYTAKAYTGETLTKEEREAQDSGIFHILNSYTPLRTNWGIKFIGADSTNVFSDFEYAAYDLNCGLSDQEYFNFYLSEPNVECKETAKLWAFEHRDYRTYPEIMSEKDLEGGIQIGVFSYDEDTHSYRANAFIPNRDAGGFADGAVDLLITYGDDENVAVGVLTVYTGVGGKG